MVFQVPILLCSVKIVRAVARSVIDSGISRLVLNPVMVSGSGIRLLVPEALDVFCSEPIPKATVITPNVPEAEVGCSIRVSNSRL